MIIETHSILEKAIQEARIAYSEGNYPIGCILTDSSGIILGSFRNKSHTTNDITAHAEVECIRITENRVIDNTAKNSTILYTSLEPCGGCSFFIERTSISKVIWALSDPHKGGFNRLKHNVEFTPHFRDIDTLAEPFEDLKEHSRRLMYNYFAEKNRPDTAQYYR